MLKFAPYILKTVWRHRTRTLLTISGAAVAIFVLCFVVAVQQGLERMLANDDARRTLIVFQESRFCPTSSRLPQDYARRIAALEGVEGVLPIQVWTNNCRASLDVVVVHGVPAAALHQYRPIQLVAGDGAAFEARRDAALVGRQFAARRHIQVGSQLTFGDLSVHVAGIFRSDYPAEEDLIYTHLELLQLGGGQGASGLVTQLEVHVRDSADPDAVAREIDATLRSGPVATATRTKGAFQAGTISDLVDLISFTHWLGIACIGLVLSLVATTTVMSVQDRIKEHAVLQTLGLRPGRLRRIVVAESTLLCLGGGLMGTAAAWVLLAVSHLSVGAEGVAIVIRPSWVVLASGLAVSILVGCLAGWIPGWQASRADIVTSLRQG